MLVFKDQYNYTDSFPIIFLCGSYFNKKSDRDKRTTLKNHIEKEYPKMHPIILEEHFVFKKTNNDYLSYDEIFLKNLAQVEQLASLYSSKIIVIHESISTATEIGAFAINPSTAKKMCMLVPDDMSIEEEKDSTFIRLAFLNHRTKASNINKITFYPDLEIVKKSPNKIDYHTYFHNNEIGEVLASKIKQFLTNSITTTSYEIKSTYYGNPTTSTTTVDYNVNNESEEVFISISTEVLKAQLLSLFFQKDFKQSLRKPNKIKDHVSYIQSYYLKILSATINLKTKNITEKYNVKVSIKETTCTLRQAIGYFIYMLQAIDLIALKSIEDDKTKRKFTIKPEFESYKDAFSNIIYNYQKTDFGRLLNE